MRLNTTNRATAWRRGIAAALSAVIVLTTAGTAHADVWSGDPAPQGSQADIRYGYSTGGSTFQCINNTGWGGGQMIWDRYWYGCQGLVNYKYVSIMLEGFDVWRFYGTQDAAGNTTSVKFGTWSRVENARLGQPWRYGYDFFAPHPMDAGTNTFGNSTFNAGQSSTPSGRTAYFDARFAQVPGPVVTTIKSPGFTGDCRTLRTPLMDQLVAKNSLPALTEIKNRYTQHLNPSAGMPNGYGTTIAATMANLKRPPTAAELADPTLQSLKPLWDDGVPCSSTLEYATLKSAPERPQVVTCWLPTMRRSVYHGTDGYGGVQASPYAQDLAWRNGILRYTESAPYDQLRSDFSQQRKMLADERYARGIFGADLPYRATDPLWDPYPVRNPLWAAIFASAHSHCQDTTSNSIVDAPTDEFGTKTVVTKVVPTDGSVTLAPDQDGIPVGGTMRPTTVSASTGDVNCRMTVEEQGPGAKPGVQTTDSRCADVANRYRPQDDGMDLNLTLSSVGGLRTCTNGGPAGCYYETEDVTYPGGKATKVYAYRASPPGTGVRADATDATWKYTWFEVVDTYSCTSKDNGATWKCDTSPTDTVTIPHGGGQMPMGSASATYSLVGSVSTPR